MDITRKKRVLNAGSGAAAAARLREFFSVSDYDEVRLDIDASVKPDLVGSFAGMRGQIADASFDAVWSSHSLEHLHAHEAPVALAEFRRVLRADGFAIITCPNVAAAARLLETQDIEEVGGDHHDDGLDPHPRHSLRARAVDRGGAPSHGAPDRLHFRPAGAAGGAGRFFRDAGPRRRRLRSLGRVANAARRLLGAGATLCRDCRCRSPSREECSRPLSKSPRPSGPGRMYVDGFIRSAPLRSRARRTGERPRRRQARGKRSRQARRPGG